VSDSLGREEAHGGCHHNEDFAVANQKAVSQDHNHNSLGAALAERDKRVLIVDLILREMPLRDSS